MSHPASPPRSGAEPSAADPGWAGRSGPLPWVLARAAFAVLAVLLLCGLYLGLLQLAGNRHTVIAGELYRSAQPDASMIEDEVARHGIRSVLNLRGEAAGTAWYDTERATAARLGLVHRDFKMSASHALDADRTRALMALMQQMPKPLLIHCKSGADRTGLAAALYLAQAGGGETASRLQLSPLYGHIGIPHLSAAWPMDRTWQAAQLMLDAMGR